MSDDLIARLQAEEALELTAFDFDEAWMLGTSLRALAASRGHGVGIDIRRSNGMILFRTALPGATKDQDDWIARKAAVVLRFECSSALLAARLEGAGVDAAAMGWLPSGEYAVTGGSVPIRVRGAGVVAAVTVSGLSSEADHDLAVEALRLLAAS